MCGAAAALAGRDIVEIEGELAALSREGLIARRRQLQSELDAATIEIARLNQRSEPARCGAASAVQPLRHCERDAGHIGAHRYTTGERRPAAGWGA